MNNSDLETLQLHEFVEKSYLDYAMYVVLDRALPHMFDGLKPVQRRIVYAMSELGLKASAKYKKSARTVGDVLGKFHPHGDVACYEAMVLMAQSFSYRYPLVDGQGNWGSADDPKSFAAMRYTEAKLSKYAQVLLAELNQGNTEWVQNFDGTLLEPVLLPARLPNMLLNGASGIAVGMATDVPPHNMTEVVTGMVHLLDNPNANITALLDFIKAPDYPTGAEIVSSKADILNVYQTGKGSIRQRACFINKGNQITINKVPYQVSPAKICQQIAKQMQEKTLPMLLDVTDQSDHAQPVCLVLQLRSNRVDVNALMEHLYASTDLEKTSRVNLNIIGTNGRPKVCNLLEFCQDWLSKRQEVVRKRLSCRLDKIKQRLDILAGLLLVHLHIDEVIKIVRAADDPKQELMQRFSLTEIQAVAILEIRLKQLAKLEKIALEKEQGELSLEESEIEQILASNNRLKKLIKRELLADLAEHGDARRSPIVARAAAASIALKPVNDPVTLVFSKNNWVRIAKGHDLDISTVNFRAGDELSLAMNIRANDKVGILDGKGQLFNLEVSDLPGIRTQGAPLTKYFNLANNIFKFLLDSPMLIAQTAGFGFIASDLQTKLRSGKKVVSVLQDSEILPPVPIKDQQQSLVLISNTGRMLIYALQELPNLKKGKGNQLMRLITDEKLVLVKVLAADSSLIIKSGRRKLVLTPKDWQCFCGKRAQRGRLLPSAFRKVTALLSKH